MEDHITGSSEMETLWTFDWSQHKESTDSFEQSLDFTTERMTEGVDPLTATSATVTGPDQISNANPDTHAAWSAQAQIVHQTECADEFVYEETLPAENHLPDWTLLPLKWPSNLPAPCRLPFFNSSPS
jgi:hypothetical protein